MTTWFTDQTAQYWILVLIIWGVCLVMQATSPR